MTQSFPPDRESTARMPFLDVLRAAASVAIVLHHFANYPPFCDQVAPVSGGLVRWLHDYARVTQVFFVIGGYVMARSLTSMSWGAREFGLYAMRRYLRLGIPYLAAVLMAMATCSFGREWLPDSVVGAAADLPRFLAHVVFLHDLLGMEPLSAGIWFVCISFQLGLCHTALLVARDRWFPVRKGGLDFIMVGGSLVSILSLMYFNVDPRWDVTALYFYPYFFMGVVVHHACSEPGKSRWFWFYLILILCGMAWCWRPRLLGAVAVGWLLFSSVRGGWLWNWPKNRWIAWLGKVSYSLFLVHFPVLVAVSTVWTRLGWTSPPQALAGLVFAFVASLAVAWVFYLWVEIPSVRLSRRWVVGASCGKPELSPSG